MAVEQDIRSAVKIGKAVLGFKESIKTLKSGEANTVIVSNNIPQDMGAEIKHNAEISGVKVEFFEGSSKDLGTACGKPFPVSVMVIKG